MRKQWRRLMFGTIVIAVMLFNLCVLYGRPAQALVFIVEIAMLVTINLIFKSGKRK